MDSVYKSTDKAALPILANIDPNGFLRMKVVSRDWTSTTVFPRRTLVYVGLLLKMILEGEGRETRLELLEQEKWNGSTHDMGFRMYCSYGNGYPVDSGFWIYKDRILFTLHSLPTP
ncbi:MAG: hypothetical protein ACLR6J_07925 [Parabacteroides merdae]